MLFAGADGFFERVVIGATIGRVKFLGFEYNVAFPTNVSDNAVNLICHNSFVVVAPVARGRVYLFDNQIFHFLCVERVTVFRKLFDGGPLRGFLILISVANAKPIFAVLHRHYQNIDAAIEEERNGLVVGIVAFNRCHNL